MAHDHVYASIIEAICDTPIIELSRVTRGVDGRILVKLEYLLPGGSKKDRAARQIIEEAKANQALKPGQTVVELTSGNAGTGFAIVCQRLGHPFVAVMSKGNSIERRIMMQALGAEVILVDQAPGGLPGKVSGEDLDLVEKGTQQIVCDRNAFRADQFSLPGNFRAHYLHTGPEILRQTSGRFEAFCDFVGTAGSFAGCSQAFKEYNPAIACYIVEPPQSAVLSGETVQNPSHEIQGSIVAQADAPKEKQIEIAGPFIAFSKWLQEAYRQPVGAPLSTDELDKLVASAPRGRAQSNLGYFAGSFFYHRHDLEQARRYLAQCQKGGHTGSQRTISLLPATRPAGRRTAEKAGEIATNNSAPGAEAWQIEYGPNRVVANFQ